MAAAEHDVTRIEAFSDAVFGFAITLLVVSLEVPNSFDELLQVMRGLPVFAVTFAILLMIWQEHHNLFKHFPSSDGVTIWLNGALLFVVVVLHLPAEVPVLRHRRAGRDALRTEHVVHPLRPDDDVDGHLWRRLRGDLPAVRRDVLAGRAADDGSGAAGTRRGC